MATFPIIVNKRPAEGDSNVNALAPFRFGLRDEETRVSLATVYSAVAYARAVYRPDELPDDDELLQDEGIRTRFSVFNDAAGASLPGAPADQSVQVVGLEKVYRIERSIAGPQEGFRYLEDDYVGENPYAVEVQLDLPVVSTGTTAYVTYVDFTGAVVGFINWFRNTGVFLFFRDDGSKKVTVAGPAIDGLGTRSVEVTVPFDWSTEAFTYKILWDETPSRRKVLVLAVGSSGTEYVLAELATTVFPQFLSSVELGGNSASSPPDKVVLMVGTDGPSAGDQIDIYKADLFRFGKALVINGGKTGSSSLSISSNELLLVQDQSDLVDWTESGVGELSTTDSGAIALVREAGLPAGTFSLERTEPDLVRKEWMLFAEITGRDSVHPGTFNTAMGFDVEDGTHRHVFRFLDDFFTRDMGLFSSGSLGDVEDYFTAPEPRDWEEDQQIILLGSQTRDEVRGYIENDDELLSFSTGAYATTLPSTETRVRFGLLESDVAYTGGLYLLRLWLLMNCTFYEPLETTFPEAQGWSRVSSGSVRSLLSTDRLRLDCDISGSYDIYYIEDANYDEQSGATIFLKGKVTRWTDETGAVNPPRKPIGPIAFLASTTVGPQLYFVESETGKRYVYLPQENNDVADVLARNAAGLRISAELDFGSDHVYMLVLKPNQHIRLYVDYSPTPIIDIPWSSKGIGMRSFPTNMPASAVAGFGSLGENNGVDVEIAYGRVSLGTGYDLVVTPMLAEADLHDHVYGSEAELLVDFEDLDP